MTSSPFTFWCCSLPNKNAPRTLNNSQHSFVVKLPSLWNLQDQWEVYVQTVICSEIRPSETHKDLLLYSDLIEYEIVGHDKFPLLEWMPPTLDSHIRYQESFHPYIRRVAKSHFDHIGFKIVDTKGHPPRFIRKSPTFIALHFRPSRDNHNDKMDMTLLSNQSRIYFPKNTTNRFTAQLPSIVKMEANEWKVALAKATLPAVNISNVVTRNGEKLLLSYTPFDSKTQRFQSTRELEIDIPNAKWQTLENLIDYTNNLMKKQLKHKAFIGKDGSQGKLLDELIRGLSQDDRLRTIGIEKWENGKLVDGNWKSYVFPKNELISLKAFLLKFEELGFKIKWENPKDPQWRLLTITNLNPGFQNIRPKELLEQMGFEPLKYDLEFQKARFPPFTYYYKKRAITIPFFELKLKWNKKAQRTVLRCELWNENIYDFSISFTKGLNDLFGFQEQTPLQFERNGQTFCQYLLCNGLFKCGSSASNGTHVNSPGRNLFHENQSSDAAFYSTSISPDPNCDWTRVGFVHLQLKSKKLLNSTAHITCSLLDPIKIGDIDQPLLDIVPLNENTDSNGDFYDYVFEPKHLKYRSIGVSSFQTIDITVENDQGELLHLDNSGVSTFSLKFVKS